MSPVIALNGEEGKILSAVMPAVPWQAEAAPCMMHAASVTSVLSPPGLGFKRFYTLLLLLASSCHCLCAPSKSPSFTTVKPSSLPMVPFPFVSSKSSISTWQGLVLLCCFPNISKSVCSVWCHFKRLFLFSHHLPGVNFFPVQAGFCLSLLFLCNFLPPCVFLGSVSSLAVFLGALC